MHVECNIMERSLNHCSNGKTVMCSLICTGIYFCLKMRYIHVSRPTYLLTYSMVQSAP